VGSKVSLFVIATRQQAGLSGIRIPIGAKDFSLLQMSRLAQGSPSLLFSEYEGSFPVVKQLHCEAKHSPPSSTEVKNDWRYTSTPHICLHAMERENLTVLPYLGCLCTSKWV
jgi:hypothetical protein